MTESQYAVFHFDVKTMTMAPGEPLIFNRLDDAQSHCQQAIAAKPTQGCRIYNQAGTVVQTYSDEQIYTRHHGRPAAKRNVLVGGLCLLVGFGGVALDAWLEWQLILGVLLGVRFLWVGTVKMAEGIAGLTEER